MNKNIKKLLSYILVMSSLVACSAQEDHSTIELPAEEEITVDVPIDTPKFVIDTTMDNLDLLEMKLYIDAHKSDATVDEMDQMILVYDQALRSNYQPLFDQFIEAKYFKAINDTKDDHYVLHIDNIKDTEIRKAVTQAVEEGYCFTMLEGAYYLVIDYKDIANNYGNHMSDDLNAYYTVKKAEQLEPIRVEEYLNIDSAELYKRFSLLEGVVNTRREFIFRADVITLMTAYVDGLLSIDVFSGSIDYETGQVSQTRLELFETIVTSDSPVLMPPIQEILAFLETKDFIVKFDDQVANEEVWRIRNKYMEEVPKLIDLAYPLED